MLNKDILNHVAPASVIQASLTQLDQTSHEEREVQAVAFAVTLLAYAARHGMEIGDVFTVANNLMHSKHGSERHYCALRDYMRYEL